MISSNSSTRCEFGIGLLRKAFALGAIGGSMIKGGTAGSPRSWRSRRRTGPRGPRDARAGNGAAAAERAIRGRRVYGRLPGLAAAEIR